jgi:sterol desaturase/sphingolipid hydroxylase (fatty acid hydroxylase superfamily)
MTIIVHYYYTVKNNMLLYILFYDLWFYFSHILLHTNTLYQIVHKLHHQTPYSALTYEDTNKAHILENFIQPLGIFICISGIIILRMNICISDWKNRDSHYI